MYGENNKFVPNHQPEDASFFMVFMGKSRHTLRENSWNMWELVTFFPVFDGKKLEHVVKQVRVSMVLTGKNVKTSGTQTRPRPPEISELTSRC